MIDEKSKAQDFNTLFRPFTIVVLAEVFILFNLFIMFFRDGFQQFDDKGIKKCH